MYPLSFLSRSAPCPSLYSRSAEGGPAPQEASAFLRDLVHRAAPRGLSDPAEDVCAAAARAIRLVMLRFLSREEARGASSGGVGLAAVDVRPRGKRWGEGEGRKGGGGGRQRGHERSSGEEVFDLVWKALEDLDQDSACVEVCGDT